MTNNRWEISGASVVIVAQSHNPSIINPDFLRDNKIVDPSCKISLGSAITTPVVTQINYGNIAWQVTPERCVISAKSDINSDGLDQIYESARKYIETLRHIPYVALGLNWQMIRTLHADSNEWLKLKFLREGSWENKIESVDLTFRLRSENPAVCSLAVKGLRIHDKNHLAVDCNFHFNVQPESDKVEKMLETLGKWERYKEILDGYLNEYFMEKEEVA